MINREKLQKALDAYQKAFPAIWPDEKYKWEAIRHFQDNWNIDAPDFKGMLEEALSETDTLLASGYFYARSMIVGFAQEDPEATRAAFKNLFDERKDLFARVEAFRAFGDDRRSNHNPNGWKNHYQNTNAISTYLWLRYPEKYYIYKYSVCLDTAKELDSDFIPKRNSSPATMIGGYRLYDEICGILQQNTDLCEMIDNACHAIYPDAARKTATVDLCYFISEYYHRGEPTEADAWEPAGYTPGLSVEDWTALLKDPTVFASRHLEIMKRFKDCGGAATCKQLSEKYGRSWNYYNSCSSGLARTVAEKKGCPAYRTETGETKWWPILYVGRDARKEEAGSYVWRLRPELSEALDRIDLREIALYADDTPSLWKVSHGTEDTGISDAYKAVFLRRNIIVVNSKTKAKAQSKTTQGDNFLYAMKQGDFFYLCYGNRCQLLGQLTTDDAVPNQELRGDWYERPYRLIAKAKNTEAYTGEQKWWTPNDNSTCIRIEDLPKFETLILKPYFDMTLAELSAEKEQAGPVVDAAALDSNARYKAWFVPLVEALQALGGTASRPDVHQRVIDQNGITEEELGEINQSGVSRILNDIDWARNYLTYEGILDHDAPKGIWQLTELGAKIQMTEALAGKVIAKWVRIKAAERNHMPVPQIDLTPYYTFLPQVDPAENSLYTKADFLQEVYMKEQTMDMLILLLKNKKNLILQGAPGVGKTFTAKRLAYVMMGKKDDSRIEFIQFHQNYSYEDFIMGYKPDGSSFSLKAGIFYRFCQTASNHPEQDYFFIIDEINRGNLSKIFGELLMLIERDYRGTKAALAYTGVPFSVPQNLYIIGMMNTADRSLAMIDYALRRRFGFFEMEPGFTSEGFQAYQASLHSEMLDELLEQIRELNREISADDSLGPGFRIGHSYFCGQESCTEDWLRTVVYFDLLPMLREYWFDDKQKRDRWEARLTGVFHDE